MDRKQKIILTIGLLGLGSNLALIFLWSGNQSSHGYHQFEGDLYRAIEEQERAVRTPSDEILIRLKDITRFKWNKFYILREDSESESIARELGIRWPPKLIGPTLLFIEPFDFLVFVEAHDDTRIVHEFRHYREDVSFEKLKKPDGWSPEEAVFRFVENPPRHSPTSFLEEVHNSVLLDRK